MDDLALLLRVLAAAVVLVMAATTPRAETAIRPQPGPQETFLSSPADVVLYGGAAGGGKSFGLLLDPLRYVSNPDFGAVIFRRTYPEITQEGGLWDESEKLYPLLGAGSNQTALEWTFGSGASVGFAHLQHEKTKFQYKGAQIAYIGFDELTSFTKSQFFYMLTRNRSTSGVRPCIRATTNPDADSWVAAFIAWWIDQDETLDDGRPNPRYGLPIPERAGVVRYFARDGDAIVWGDSVDEVLARVPKLIAAAEAPDSVLRPEDLVKSFTFVPATIHDNQALLSRDPAYLANLLLQDDVERGRLLDGNWKVRAAAGNYFRRETIEVVEPEDVPHGLKPSRHWDLAGTKPSASNPDPDWTCGSKLAEAPDGTVYWLDAVLLRDAPARVEQAVKVTASQDGRAVPVYLEQEPGQSGKSQIEHYARNVLKGFAVHGSRPGGEKTVRAAAPSAAAGRGQIKLVRGDWNDAVLRMLERFPDPAEHDDPVDTLSQFWAERMAKSTTTRPRRPGSVSSGY